MQMCWTLVLFLSSITAGWCIGGFIDPPSGSLVVGFEGDENLTTIDCEVFTDSTLQEQLTTLWFIQDFRNVSLSQMINEIDDPFTSLFLITGTERNDSIPNLTTFRNNLTILRFDATLDGTTLFCGSGRDQEIGNFSLRIYREPTLVDNLQMNIIEGTLNAKVDLSESPPAFPFPRIFQWQKNGAFVDANTSMVTFGYPSVVFENVSRSDSGNYSLMATNYLLDNPDEMLGNDSGSFFLDVLYGPDLTLPSVTSFGSLEGGNVTLICGTNLDSNPPPSRLIEWRQDGVLIDTSNDRYLTDDGPDTVSLSIFGAMPEDTGNWTCSAMVEFVPDTSGTIITVGELVRELTLTVVVPPSPPINLTVDSIGATSVVLSWESPNIIGTPSFSKFEITATPTDNPESFSDPVPTNLTAMIGRVFEANVSGLLPNVEYTFTVRAVSVFDNSTSASSGPSEGVSTQTHTTTPAIVCTQAPESQNGVIQVVWDYDHLGGLNITRVAVNYRTDVNDEMPPVVRTGEGLNDLRSLEFSGLTAGLNYVFYAMATNENGSSTAECPPIAHSIGVPQRPVIVNTDFSTSQRLVVSVQTPEAGIETPSTISFVVQVTELISSNTSTASMMFLEYVDNEVVDIVLQGLVGGLDYEIVAKTMNQFGESGYSEPVTVTIMEDSPSTGSSVGGIVGGIVAAVVVVVIVIIIIVVVIILVYRRGRKMELPHYSYGSHEMVDNYLYSKSSPPKQEEMTKDKGMDPNYETVPVTPSKNDQSGTKHSLYDSLPPAPAKVDNPLYSSTGELHHSMNLDSINVHVPQPSQSVDDLTSKSSNNIDSQNLSSSKNDQPKGEQEGGAWYATVPTPVSLASRSTHASAASLGMSDSDILPPPPPMVHPGSEEHVYTEL